MAEQPFKLKDTAGEKERKKERKKLCFLLQPICTPTVDFSDEPNHYSVNALCCLTVWTVPQETNLTQNPSVGRCRGRGALRRRGFLRSKRQHYWSAVSPQKAFQKSHPCLLHINNLSGRIWKSLWTCIHNRQNGRFKHSSLEKIYSAVHCSGFFLCFLLNTHSTINIMPIVLQAPGGITEDHTYWDFHRRMKGGISQTSRQNT